MKEVNTKARQCFGQALERIKELELIVTNLEEKLQIKVKEVEFKYEIIEKLSSRQSFTSKFLKSRPVLLKYMCGLTVEQFDVLWACIETYTSQISYKESASSNRINRHLLRQSDELLTVLTCCKNGLDLGVSEWMAGISEASMQHLFTAQMIFLASLFGCLNLMPAPGFLQTIMSKIFKETGHHLTGQIGDCTEFKL